MSLVLAKQSYYAIESLKIKARWVKKYHIWFIHSLVFPWSLVPKLGALLLFSCLHWCLERYLPTFLLVRMLFSSPHRPENKLNGQIVLVFCLKQFLVEVSFSPYPQFPISREDTLGEVSPRGVLTTSARIVWAQNLKRLLHAETTGLFLSLLFSLFLKPFLLFSSFSISLLRIGLLLSSFSPQATLSHFSHYEKISSVEKPKFICQHHSFIHPHRITFLRNPIFSGNCQVLTDHGYVYFVWAEGIVIPKPSSKWRVMHFWLIL